MSPTLASGRCHPRWGVCLTLVLAAHAAVALLILQRAPGSLPSSAAAAPLVLALAPALPATASPPGPSPARQAAVAPPVPSVPALNPEPSPRAAPSAAAPPLVPRSKPKPRQTRGETPPPLSQAQRHAPSPYAEAGAATAILPAPAATGPSSADNPAAAPDPAGSGLRGWQSDVLGRLQRAKRYPDAARLRDEQGIATVTFVMDRNGRVLWASLVRSSGSTALDEEALALVHRAEPLPTMPPEVAGDSIKLTVPVAFSLR